MDVRRGAESMQGRRGAPADDDPLDKVLRPMSFGEFVRARDADIARRLSGLGLADAAGRARLAREVASGAVGPALVDLSAYKGDLDAHLDAYLQAGGMPAVVDEFERSLRIGRAAYESYLGEAESDLAQSGRSVPNISQLVPNILRSMGSGVSWSSLRRDTGMESTRTVEECIEALGDTFALHVLYRYDPATDMPNFDSPKKLYMQDPFFFHAYSGAHVHGDPFDASIERLADPEKKAALVEQVVADHAIRLAFALAPAKIGFRSAYAVFYWMGGGRAKREVDLVVRDSKSLVPIDVKYRGGVSRSDLYGLSDFGKETGTKGACWSQGTSSASGPDLRRCRRRCSCCSDDRYGAGLLARPCGRGPAAAAARRAERAPRPVCRMAGRPGTAPLRMSLPRAAAHGAA